MRKIVFICVLLVMSMGLYKESNAQAGRMVFSGVIVDSSSIGAPPVAGASIFTKRPKRAVGTSAQDGSFSVIVPKGAKLLIESIGKKTIEIEATEENIGKTFAMVVDDGEALNAISVNAFGTKMVKEDQTGSAVIISGKDLQGVPAADLVSLIQGRVPGVNIQNDNGMPGARSSTLVRGLSNLNVAGEGGNAYLTPTSPLFVVDGVPVDVNSGYEYGFSQGGPGTSPLSLIPVEDVEEIAVLKDAAAASLWGAKGAYGVILITTKRGKSQRPQVTYQGQFFFNTIPQLRKVLGGKGERYSRINQILNYDTAFAAALARINRTDFLSDSLNPYYNNSTDWQAVFFGPTSNQSHNVGISGGTNEFNYKTNIGFYDQKGIIRNTGFTRYNLNMSAGFKPSDDFNINVNVNSGLSTNKKGSGNGLLQQGVARGAASTSLLPPPSEFSANNDAVAGVIVKDNNRTFSVRPGLNMMWRPFGASRIGDLQLVTNASYSYTSEISENYRPSLIGGGKGLNSHYNAVSDEVYNRNGINYVKSFGKILDGEGGVTGYKHTMSMIVFNEITTKNRTANTTVANATANDQILGPVGYDWWYTSAGLFAPVKQRTVAFGANLHYDYKKKYVLDFQYRSDKSSLNGPLTKFSSNPTYSFRWNMNREDWFKVKWIDISSIRASYGVTLIPVGNIFTAYGVYRISDNFNGHRTVSSDFSRIPNPYFEQSRNKTLDIGYEATMFNNFLTISYDYYYKEADKQEWSLELANTTGFRNKTVQDLASVSYGHEFLLSLQKDLGTETKPIRWRLSLNAAYNKNILAQFPNNLRAYVLNKDLLPVLYRLGRVPLGTLVFNTVGVYSTDKDVAVDPATGLPIRIGGTNIFLQKGDPRWTDVNGDYMITNDDLVSVFDPQPKVTGGMQFYFKYGRWSLNTNISATLFRDAINTALAEKFKNFAQPERGSSLPPIDEYSHWKKDGDVAIYPNPYNFLYNSIVDPYRYNQTLFIEDGSYVKLNQLSIDYELDRKWSKKHLGITSARLGVSGGNLLVLSPYSGPSPENISADLGRDRPDSYPNARTISFNLNIQF